MSNAAPAPYQLEISVFGPGVGECVVVHIGDGDWIVVDSCIDRQTHGPIALDYLRSLNVDVASQVRLVVATHWHDDHIQGLAEVFRATESARFVNSAAFTLAELLRLAMLGETAPLSSATMEYRSIIEVLRQRRLKGERLDAVGPIPALANKKLLSLSNHERSFQSEVFALSPGDGVFNLAQAELSNALAAIKNGRRLPKPQGPNRLCVVLWLRVGVLDILLGADLEHVPGSTEGWQAIVGSAERPQGRARFLKVPHHGSINADCSQCWTDLLLEQPIAIVTPYARSMLPGPLDIERLCQRTQRVFLTSDPTRYPLPRRDNPVERTLRELAIKRRALVGRMGHVQLRCDARNTTEEPKILLKNGARGCCLNKTPASIQ